MVFSSCEAEKLIDNLPEALFLMDTEGKVLDANTEACELLGYEEEELLELTVDDLVPEGVPAFLPDQLNEAMSDEELLETVILGKGGKEMPIDLRKRVIAVEGEKRLLAYFRELSERREAWKKYQVVAEGTSQAIYLFQEGEFKYSNEALEKVSGYSGEELRNIDFLELVHPDYRSQISNWTGKALSGDDSKLPDKVEFKALRKDGEAIWVRTFPSLIDYRGRPAIVGNVVEITEEKKLKEELKRKDRAVESALSGIAIANMEGELEYVNPSFLHMWGYEEEEEVVGRDITEFWLDKERVEAKVLETLREKGRWRGELVGEKKDGTSFPVQALASLIRDEQDRPIALMSSFIDLTERKQAEKTLQGERDKLRNLHDAVDLLQQQESEEELAQTAVETAEEMLEFELCAIAFLEGDELVPKANSADLDLSDNKTFEIGEGLAGKTVQRGETIWGDDVRDYPEAKPTKDEWKAFISVPIGEVGNMQVTSKKKGSFNQRDVRLAEILANHLSEEIQRIRLEEELKEQAIRDPLTGLYNRRYFNETLEKEVEKCKRYGESLVFLMLDVNRFKVVNDRYTHQTGDKVLQEVANLLEENVRDADTVVRYGGDEFLIMMPETSRVESTVNRIEEELKAWNKESDLLDFPLTLAMGSSQWNPVQSRDVEEALKEADQKMYEDKESCGRD